MANLLKLRVTKACYIGGQVVQPGVIVSLAPSDAQDATDSGKCELVDANDASVAMAGRREAVLKVLSRERSLAQMPPGPWQPWN